METMTGRRLPTVEDFKAGRLWWWLQLRRETTWDERQRGEPEIVNEEVVAVRLDYHLYHSQADGPVESLTYELPGYEVTYPVECEAPDQWLGLVNMEPVPPP